MPQVPFPTNIQTVKLRRPQEGARLFGNTVLGVTLLATLGAAFLVAVRAGVFENLGRHQPATEVAQSTTQPAVRGERIPDEQLADRLSEFALNQADLPDSLNAYAVSEDETGPTAEPLGQYETLAGYRTVLVGPDPLALVTSTVYAFSTSSRAAQTYIRTSSTDGLRAAVGQPVRVTAPLLGVDAGFVFREQSSVLSTDGPAAPTQTFAGALVVHGRLIHLLFGFFPVEVTEDTLLRLARTPVERYESSVSGRLSGKVKDQDLDGLPDTLEDRFGTDPEREDTDSDGFTDLIELQNGYDPLGEGRQPSSDSLFVIPGLGD